MDQALVRRTKDGKFESCQDHLGDGLEGFDVCKDPVGRSRRTDSVFDIGHWMFDLVTWFQLWVGEVLGSIPRTALRNFPSACQLFSGVGAGIQQRAPFTALAVWSSGMILA